MSFRDTYSSIKKILNDNQGPIAGIVVILMLLQMFGFQANIFTWPALFMALPLESKVWYLWIFNLSVTVIIGLFLQANIKNVRFSHSAEDGNEDPNKIKNIELFESEIKRIEKTLESVNNFESDQEKISFVVDDLQMGKKHFFNIPVYSQFSKEMMQFSEELRDNLIIFYENIRLIEQNQENFNVEFKTSGKITYTSYDKIQIMAFFENIKKIREQIPNLKILFQKELKK
jgi:hypothetical protein